MTFGSVRIVLSSGPVSWIVPLRDDEAVLMVATASPPVPDTRLATRGHSVAYFARGRNPSYHDEPGREVLHLAFPVRVLEGIDLQIGRKYAIDTDSALLWPLFVFARALAFEAGKRTAMAAYYAERLLQEMIAGVAVASVQFSSGRLALNPYGAAMSMIAASFADPTLTPARLANDLNVSLRTLQRQFSSRGTTIERAVRRARVEHATSLLADAVYDSLSIERIAHACGLSNGSSLARAFAAEGLASPATVRKRGAHEFRDARARPHARTA